MKFKTNSIWVETARFMWRNINMFRRQRRQQRQITRKRLRHRARQYYRCELSISKRRRYDPDVPF